MDNYKIVTDSTADLPQDYLEKNEIGVMTLPYTIDGITYDGTDDLDTTEFYKKMRAGKMPTTSQVNPTQARQHFEEYRKEFKKILYISFSSGLSGTYNSVSIAAGEIMEENPDVEIIVIDSKCASLGEGLFVHLAVEMKKAGKEFHEVAEYLESHKLNLVHVFTVDDLFHLYRGGRVSKTTAVVGTLASIKPVMHVDDEGHLVPVGKVRGRKKSLHELVDLMEKKIGSYRDKNEIVFISHGDSAEDAQYVADEVKARFGIEKFLIHDVGPTIGAHSGPGTIALFFLGDSR